MFKMIWASMVFAFVTLFLTGILYPYFVTFCAQILFPYQANGSFLKNDAGQIVGSELIAQPFSNPAYFQPRPSAAGNGYDPTSSGGSNFGQTSQKLLDRISSDVTRLQKENSQAIGSIPVELVTTSGSGLDPDLSPEGAIWQMPRVASARGVTVERVKQVLDSVTNQPQFGFLGESRVNVLKANLALDRRFGAPSK
ncbi:MAG: potassium-transporting ATPase subunit KdpC [Candidatus Riflebacteria bacterium]|nr:potassium-transporting ATPase subunit KdpC [Candidatus Riflebacteria bacterium]